jgi:hypothetical protein
VSATDKILFGGGNEESESVIRKRGCKLLARHIGQGTKRKKVQKVSTEGNFPSDGLRKAES